MDLSATIRGLYLEKERLESAIAALEILLQPGTVSNKAASPTASNGRHRGRISMGQEEREQVSRRMRAYWEGRRNAQIAQSGAEGHLAGAHFDL